MHKEVKDPVDSDTSRAQSVYAPSQSQSGVHLPHLVIYFLPSMAICQENEHALNVLMWQLSGDLIALT